MENEILALVVTEESRERVSGGGNILIAQDAKQAQRLALLLSRILKAVPHDLENGVLILVKHG